MRRILIWSQIILFCVSCSQKQKPLKEGEFDPKAIEINKQGVRLMDKYENDSALILFDQAIEADENYYLPHSNKAGIYISMRKYGKALTEIEMSVKKNPENPEGWTTTGMLADRLNDSIKAKQCYKKSIILLEKKLEKQNDKKKISQIKLRIALVHLLLGEDSLANEEIMQIQKDNPDNPMINSFVGIKKKDFLDQVLP